MYTKDGIQQFKDIVSTLIGDDFDNHFNLEVILDEYDAPELYAERPEGDRDLSFEDWCFLHDENTYECRPFVEGFAVTAKDPKDVDKVNKLNEIYSIFESETRYC